MQQTPTYLGEEVHASRMRSSCVSIAAVVAAIWAISSPTGGRLSAQTGPSVVDPNLDVRTVVSGLMLPTSMAFIGPDDILVLEKATGMVRRVVGGTIQGTVLDLVVNSASERGLLGIALDPHFPSMPFVYLYWTESTTGADSNVAAETPLLGNRVDRFLWNGMTGTLTMDRNLIHLRALQDDATN